jgi:hypothetical protein
MHLNRKRGLVIVFALLPVAFASALIVSPRFRHSIHKVIIKSEMKISALRGYSPRLVSIAGELGLPGVRVEALESRSGWATLSDNNGRFVLPDVVWYPNASYDLIVSTDDRRGRQIRISALQASPATGVLDAGAISLGRNGEVELANLPGLTSTSYQEYDFLNADYYRKLLAELTAGKLNDRDRVDAINRFVSERLNYNETQWDPGSPRRIIEQGSQYCGHLATAMAAISAVAYRTRLVNLSDGASPPNTHVVVEVFYEGGWHLYDPTFGVSFVGKDGSVASYKDLRLDTGAIARESFARFREKYPKVSLDWMTDVYSSGYHHYYYPAFKCSQYSHAWWEYKDDLSYVPSGGRLRLAAAGLRPGSRVTFHIRHQGTDHDVLAFTTRGTVNSCCVLNEEDSPPIALAPGVYDVFVDLRNGNVPPASASARISAHRLAMKLEVR